MMTKKKIESKRIIIAAVGNTVNAAAVENQNLSLLTCVGFCAAECCVYVFAFLLQQEHTDILQRLRFTLDFARCMAEVAASRGGEVGPSEQLSTCLHQQESVVADQISSLSREWRYIRIQTHNKWVGGMGGHM